MSADIHISRRLFVILSSDQPLYRGFIRESQLYTGACSSSFYLLELFLVDRCLMDMRITFLTRAWWGSGRIRFLFFETALLLDRAQYTPASRLLTFWTLSLPVHSDVPIPRTVNLTWTFPESSMSSHVRTYERRPCWKIFQLKDLILSYVCFQSLSQIDRYTKHWLMIHPTGLLLLNTFGKKNSQQQLKSGQVNDHPHQLLNSWQSIKDKERRDYTRLDFPTSV